MEKSRKLKIGCHTYLKSRRYTEANKARVLKKCGNTFCKHPIICAQYKEKC